MYVARGWDPNYLQIRCDACNAEPFEPCRPYCVAIEDTMNYE
jgi:hypothetical protein